MRSPMCHAVPRSVVGPFLAVTIALLLSACFGSHGMTEPGTDTGAPPSDAGVDSARPDTGRPIPDAAVDSALPPGCSPRGIDIVCNQDRVTANLPGRITVEMGGVDQCFCGERVECRARLGDEPFTLELETALCADGLLCDGCFPFIEGTCELPPLAEGSWEVRVNGDRSFGLLATEGGGLPEGGSCVTPAVVERSCGVLWPPVAGNYAEVCHTAMIPAETHAPIEIIDHCGGCGDAAGPCNVTFFDDIVRVTPSKVYSGCDIDCPDICMRRTDQCLTPRIPEGTYRLMVEGIDGYESELVVTPFDTGPAVEYRCGPPSP